MFTRRAGAVCERRGYLKLLARYNANGGPAKAAPVRAADATLDKVVEEKSSIAQALFLNRVDQKSLIYPEFEETEDLHDVESLADNVQRTILAKLDNVQIDKSQRVSDTVEANCKRLGLYAMNVPKSYGGMGLQEKGLTNIYSLFGANLSLFVKLWAQNHLGAGTLNNYANEQQKQLYLPSIAAGTCSTALCLREANAQDDLMRMETEAVFSESGDTVRILGTKSWVVNGISADLLIVFAKHQTDNNGKTLTAFLVDRKLINGVKVVKTHKTIGLRAVEMVDLHFDINVPTSCVLDKVGSGFEIANRLRNSGGHHHAAVAASLLKHLLGVATVHCNRATQFGLTLSETGFIKERLAALALDIFALETMSYYIAGHLDDESSAKYAVESSMAMFQARKALRLGLTSVMDIFGAASVTMDEHLERHLRDITTLSTVLNSDDWLVGFVAVSGLTEWAKEMSVDLEKFSRPEEYPWHFAKKYFYTNDLYSNSFKRKHYINEHVHPSLTDACRFVEEVMCKFEHIIRVHLAKKGKAIEEDACVLNRLCTVGSSIFLMLTAISRASRSYCIGLKNGELEVYTAHALCAALKRQSLHLMTELVNGGAYGWHNEDLMRDQIATAVAKNNGYPIVSPLQRNW